MTGTGWDAEPETPVKCIVQSQCSACWACAPKPRAVKPQMTAIIANAAINAIRRLRRKDRLKRTYLPKPRRGYPLAAAKDSQSTMLVKTLGETPLVLGLSSSPRLPSAIPDVQRPGGLSSRASADRADRDEQPK